MSFLHSCKQCVNYNCESDSCMQIKDLEENCYLEELSVFNNVLLLRKGNISCSWGVFVDFSMCEGQMLYLPANYKLICNARTQSNLLFIRLYCKIQFCDQRYLEDLAVYSQNGCNPDVRTPFLLETNIILHDYADQLAECIRNGLTCNLFLSYKIKELFFILGASYKKEELSLFFKEAISQDSSFSHYVIQNGYKYQSLSELADSMNMTVSGIEKRFKKVFGISGYKWMIEQKVNKLFHTICSSDSSFKEISEEFGFSSKSTFNDFCKRHLGKTPGEIRQKNTSRESLKNK